MTECFYSDKLLIKCYIYITTFPPSAHLSLTLFSLRTPNCLTYGWIFSARCSSASINSKLKLQLSWTQEHPQRSCFLSSSTWNTSNCEARQTGDNPFPNCGVRVNEMIPRFSRLDMTTFPWLRTGAQELLRWIWLLGNVQCPLNQQILSREASNQYLVNPRPSVERTLELQSWGQKFEDSLDTGTRVHNAYSKLHGKVV